MNKNIDLGFGVKLKILDTDYAKSFELSNEDAEKSQMLGMKLN